MLNQKKLNTKVLERVIYKNVFKSETHTSGTFTVNGGANGDLTYSITKSGYYPLAVSGFTIGWISGQTAMINITGLRLVSPGNGTGEITVNYRNLGTSQAQGTFIVYVLWVKL